MVINLLAVPSIFMFAAIFLATGQSEFETIKGRNTMKVAQVPDRTTPSIDVAAPTATETATFAMG